MDDREKRLASAEDDQALLRLMADATTTALADAAWAEFYVRHKDYLYAVLLRAHGRQMGEARLIEIVQDTFLRAHARAATFQVDETCGPERSRHRVRAWLGVIAENIIRDSFRGEPQVVFMSETDLEAEHDRRSPNRDLGAASASVTMRKFRNALSELTPRDQEVLRVTGMWYQPNQRQQRLPNHVMKQLAADLGTTSENIRQIRLRAIRAIRKSMERNDAD